MFDLNTTFNCSLAVSENMQWYGYPSKVVWGRAVHYCILNVNLNLHTDQLTALLLPTSKNVQQCVNPWACGTWTSATLNGVCWGKRGCLFAFLMSHWISLSCVYTDENNIYRHKADKLRAGWCKQYIVEESRCCFPPWICNSSDSLPQPRKYFWGC